MQLIISFKLKLSTGSYIKIKIEKFYFRRNIIRIYTQQFKR